MGQSSQVKPTPGAGMSWQATPVKQGWSAQPSMSVQVWPSPVNPASHRQAYPSTVCRHAASALHVAVPSRHGLGVAVSAQVVPSNASPSGHWQT